MRWYILKALLVKEWQRHLANRGGIAPALLLVAAAVLLSVFAPKEAAAGTGMVGGVHHCFVDFDRETDSRQASQDQRAEGTRTGRSSSGRWQPEDIGTLI